MAMHDTHTPNTQGKTDSKNVLSIRDLSVSFGGYKALSGVNLDVARNTIHFLIGPNGAGKTTVLDVVCAKTRSDSGSVYFYPQNRSPVRLDGLREHSIVREGVARKFQAPSVFVNLSVLENMTLSLKGHKGVIDSIFHKAADDDLEEIDRILDTIGLLEKKHMKAGSLAHGEKQWLEIGMQLAQKPEVIMLDEPAAGMGKAETRLTGEILGQVKKTCTVLVVEHDMDFVKQSADAITVLHEGKVLMEGSISDVFSDRSVKSVYLGRGAD